MNARRACVILFVALTMCAPALRAQSRPETPDPRMQNELDAFMEKALARREQNRITLQQYVLDEVEAFEILGPGRLPLYRLNRDFRWYVRDGMHVRSPVRFDGVAVGDADRQKYEDEWARRERNRLERRRKRDAGAPDAPVESAEADQSPGAPIPAPRFVSEAYFMEFKFEPGNYYLAGRERLEAHEVLRIEYYPQRMFSDDDRDREQRRPARDDGKRERKIELDVNRQMNKTALITLWVDPVEHQIVKYTFDNVWMDFLPGAWLVKVDDIRASMSMGQPFPGVWLPRAMEIHGGVTLANGSYEATYLRNFSEYRQADVTMKLRVPKNDRPGVEGARVDLDGGRPEDSGSSGPFVPKQEPSLPAVTSHSQEVISEVRVHGNTSVDDASVIALAGIAIGQPCTDEKLQEVERRLRASGNFESVDVRKRYRSLTDTTDVVVLLVVHERPGVTSVAADVDPVTGSWNRLRSRLMFLPILNYSDGYGFTYGTRFSTVSLLGIGERLSFPLTWGGTRRAAVEIERTFESGPLTRIESSFGIWQRENPHFRIDDRRLEWKGRAERVFARVVRAGVEASTASVDFAERNDRLWTMGADVALDTRNDPTFPRNAVYVGSGWTGLSIGGSPGRINRFFADTRGYIGLVGQSVFAARGQFTAADAALPPYERLLLGGSSTLRGFRAGSFSGDRTFVTSAELRIPITSVLSSAKLGVSAFFDAGTAYDVGGRLDKAEWHRGVGGGVFLIASVFRLNLDVARGLKTDDTRLHLGVGFPF
jgi:Omp85 superfamily domain